MRLPHDVRRSSPTSCPRHERTPFCYTAPCRLSAHSVYKSVLCDILRLGTAMAHARSGYLCTSEYENTPWFEAKLPTRSGHELRWVLLFGCTRTRRARHDCIAKL